MKPFIWKIALCLALVLTAGVITGLAFYQYETTGGGFKLGVDLVGGTILVYEVDRAKFAGNPQAMQEFERNSTQLAASLKRRIDPTDLYNITVRQVGPWRVEIVLPTGGEHQAAIEKQNWDKLIAAVRSQFTDEIIQQRRNAGQDVSGLKEKYAPLQDNLKTASFDDIPSGQADLLAQRLVALVNEANLDITNKEVGDFIREHYNEHQLTTEEVERVKDKIKNVGSLEFRILANPVDDKKAIDLARKFIADAQKGPGPERDALLAASSQGTVPPRPVDAVGNPILDTDTHIGRYTYSWVEVGRLERATLHLDNASEGKPVPVEGRAQFVFVDVPEKGKLPADWVGKVQPRDNERWHQAAVARGEETVTPGTLPGENYSMRTYEKVPVDKAHPRAERFEALDLGGFLLYSRRIPSNRPLPAEDRNKEVEYFILTRDPEKGKEVTGLYLQLAKADVDQNTMQPSVSFTFNQEGGNRFAELTGLNAPDQTRNLYRLLAVILDGQIVSAPRLQSRISNQGQITGHFTTAEVNALVSTLNSGALPASIIPTPASENTIGPTLGQDTINKGFWSILIAFGAVLIFMLFYYRFAGLVACVALLANLLLTVACMVVLQATFTLPGLAGLVLMLGMAVDANVLIYERLREERDRGASLALAIRNGYDRAFPTIIDTHLSSIFTAIVLYAVGNDQLKGFGISLTVGLIISLFTSLFMTRLMFDFWLARGWLHKLSMGRFLTRPNIDFMAIRYYFFTFTIVTSLLGAGLFFWRLNKGELNIDFVGGTAYSGQLNKAVTIDQLRDLLSEQRQRQLLEVETPPVPVGETGRTFQITYKGDDRPWVVNFPNPATVSEVRARASVLPDLSVEQIFVSGARQDKGTYGASPYFTVRTTEKSPELVQAEINRLMRVQNDKGEWEELLKQIILDTNPYQIQVAADQKSADAMLQPVVAAIDPKTNQPVLDPVTKEPVLKPAPVASEKVQQELAKALQNQGVKEPKLEVKGGPVAEQGAAAKISIHVEAAEPFTRAQLSRALDATVAALQVRQAPPANPFEINPNNTQATLHFVDRATEMPAFASPAQVHRLLGDSLRDVERTTDVSGQYTLTGEGVQENGRYQTMKVSLNTPLERNLLQKALQETATKFARQPQPERLENFDSQLAAETQTRALYAILASWGAILLYLWFRFGNWTFGLAAVLCLIHDLFFTLGAIALAHYVHLYVPFLGRALGLEDFKIDLPAVAALLTLVGYSVSDTIVVFDRIREVRGKNPELTPKMINDSVNQTLSRTLLTATTVFLVVIVLYIFGGEGIHLFAFVMVIGVIVGTYSSIYIASPLLLMFGEGTRTAAARERAASALTAH